MGGRKKIKLNNKQQNDRWIETVNKKEFGVGSDMKKTNVKDWETLFMDQYNNSPQKGEHHN